MPYDFFRLETAKLGLDVPALRAALSRAKLNLRADSFPEVLTTERSASSRRGAHLLVQIRVAVLDGRLPHLLQRWYPRFEPTGTQGRLIPIRIKEAVCGIRYRKEGAILHKSEVEPSSPAASNLPLPFAPFP